MMTAYMVALNEHRAFVVDPNFLKTYTCQVVWRTTTLHRVRSIHATMANDGARVF
jgi:hypothetical protein